MKEHQHSYAGGYCTICFKKQPVFKDGKEQGLSSINSGVKTSYKPPQAHRKITSEAQYEVDKLMQFFKEDIYKKGNFAKYAKAYKILGKQQIFSFISYCKEKNITSPAYFWGMYRKTYRKLNLTKNKK